MSFRAGLSIIVPCFNEKENLPLFIQKCEEAFKEFTYPLELIIVDGCSDDGSIDFLNSIKLKLDSRFIFLFNNNRSGYGADIVQGLKRAKYDTLSWTHADMQTDIKDVLESYELFNSNLTNKIVLKGKRKNRKIIEFIFTFGMQIIVWLFLKVRLDDINAQPKMFSREFFQQYIQANPPKDFSIDLFLLYQAKINSYKIITKPVFFKNRLYGEAKGGAGSWKNRLNLIKRSLKYIIALRKLP